MAEQVTQWRKTFWQSLRATFPVILFFLTAFLSVYLLFGIHYVMMVSILTVFFKTRYKKNDNTLIRYIRLILVGSLLVVLAYASSLNIWLCIILNITVPFCLVFTQSTQFKPKGYFSFAMIFVFLSMIPPDNLEGVGRQLIVFWFCVVLLAVFIGVYYRFFAKRGSQNMTLEYILCEISEMMFLIFQPEKKKELEHRFRNLLHDFNQISYHQNFFSVRTKENQIYDMVNTLIQRFSYLITDDEWRNELDEEGILLLGRIATFLKETAMELDAPSYEKQIKTAQMHLDRMMVPEGRIRIFCRSMLHMIILILKTRSDRTERFSRIHRINWREIRQQITTRFSLESFETRVAMRVSAVMTISCIISYILPVTHSYWIPLNAFLLIQPSCEESSYRMKTRPVGTMIGCCIEFLVHPLLPGIVGQLAFALVMISLMYCATPGTWYHPIFSTCYALTLAGMTMDETTAITLRLLFLMAAVVIVFVVNRFFFPVRSEALFRYNIKALLRLNRIYWKIIGKNLERTPDLSVSGEILTYFHMVYEECTVYLRKNPALPSGRGLRVVLLTLWHMFSELEQMHYLVSTGAVSAEEKEDALAFITRIRKDLYPRVNSRDIIGLRRQIHYREPEVNYVFNKYLMHAELLGRYRKCIPGNEG